jgi:hypothetical protein
MKRWATAAVVVLSCLGFMLPSQAFGNHTTTRVVSTVSGAQIASEMLAQLKGVQVGSTSATVTVGAAGQVSPVRFEFADVARSVEEQPGGWLTLAAIPMVGGAAIRFLSFLAKLGGS